MTDYKTLAAEAALNKMMRDGHVSVCTLRDVGTLLGADVRGAQVYPILATLHCVSFNGMAPELRDAIPDMIRECLNMPSYQFSFAPPIIPPPPAFAKSPELAPAPTSDEGFTGLRKLLRLG